MQNLRLILIVGALVLFAIAALAPEPNPTRLRLTNAGLVCLSAAWLFG